MSDGRRTRRIQDLIGQVRTGGGRAGEDAVRLRPVVSDDPDVLERYLSTDRHAPTQVVTAWAPGPRRPGAYPPDLPFLPGVQVFVTEFPGGEEHPGARWVTADPSGTARTVVEDCLSRGWRPSGVRSELMPFPDPKVVLRREDRALLVLEGRLADGRGLVQLLELV